MADAPDPAIVAAWHLQIVQTADTCWGARRFQGTRLPIDTFVPLVILHGYTEAQLQHDYPSFPAGGVDVIRQVYERERAEWDAAWAREAAGEEPDDPARTVLRELLAAAKAVDGAWDRNRPYVEVPWAYAPTRSERDLWTQLRLLRKALQRAEAVLGEGGGRGVSNMRQAIAEARWWNETGWYLVRTQTGTVEPCEISRGSTYEYDLWEDREFETKQAATDYARQRLADALATVQALQAFRL